MYLFKFRKISTGNKMVTFFFFFKFSTTFAFVCILIIIYLLLLLFDKGKETVACAALESNSLWLGLRAASVWYSL